uniref:Putative secreted protein n=1 Tax=Ixodes ricinus TaxID=34613 RepID=A0A6B0V4D2_IXORI
MPARSALVFGGGVVASRTRATGGGGRGQRGPLPSEGHRRRRAGQGSPLRAPAVGHGPGRGGVLRTPAGVLPRATPDGVGPDGVPSGGRRAAADGDAVLAAALLALGPRLPAPQPRLLQHLAHPLALGGRGRHRRRPRGTSGGGGSTDGGAGRGSSGLDHDDRSAARPDPHDRGEGLQPAGHGQQPERQLDRDLLGVWGRGPQQDQAAHTQLPAPSAPHHGLRPRRQL